MKKDKYICFTDLIERNNFKNNVYTKWYKYKEFNDISINKNKNNTSNIRNLRREYIKNMKHWNDNFYDTYMKNQYNNNYHPFHPFHANNRMLNFNRKQLVCINTEIHTIRDIINIIENNPLRYDCEYNINLEALHKILVPLKELDRMIGMDTLKENILDQILFYIQGLQEGTNDFMHTCIYGSPGTGKTEIAKIIGHIFSNLGVLKKNTFKKVTRSDLVAGYLGQTAMKTRNVIKESLGGVLFIDEAYSLGNSEKKDSFSKECIDTLCECLSNYKDELMVIIAGYEKDLNNCFFAYNQGLNSRFTWRYKTDNYTPKQLRDILHKKINDIGWSLEDINIPSIRWFDDKMEYFKYFGRDMETLLSKIKICHSRRVFLLDKTHKKVINQKDIENGFQKFIDNEEVKNRKENHDISFKNMYI